MNLRRFVSLMLPGWMRSIVRSIIKRAKAKSEPSPQRYIPPEILDPNPCKGILVVTGFGSWGFRGAGKVRPKIFFPPFVYALYRNGIRVSFAIKIEELLKFDDHKNVIVAHIFSEEGILSDSFHKLKIPNRNFLVFNRPELGEILGQKAHFNRLMSMHGIPVPKLVTDAGGEKMVFSNAASGSGADAYLLNDRNSKLDSNRYNTEYIENRRIYNGHYYYNTVRLLTVGCELVHAYVRLRPDSEGSASVHAKNTPLDPALIEYFQKILVEDRINELKKLSEQIGLALGPGFFVHDTIISSETEEIFVSESGIKFEDDAYINRLYPIAAYLPSHYVMFSPEFAKRSARAFVKECQRLGCFSG